MADIRDRIGLDYLAKRGVQREPEPEPRRQGGAAFIDEALLAYGRPMLDAVRRAAPAPARVYAIVDDLQIPIDVALELVDHLEQNGYLVVVSRDLRGNHEVRLTDAGLRLPG
jgi:hypothetical protein